MQAFRYQVKFENGIRHIVIHESNNPKKVKSVIEKAIGWKVVEIDEDRSV